MSKKQVTTTGAEITQLSEDVFKIVYTDEFIIEREHAVEMGEILKKMTEGKPVYYVTDMLGRYNAFTPEAQKYLAQEAEVIKEDKVKGSAIIVNNLPNRLIAKFFLRLYKPNYPCKVFSDYDKAMEWIDELKTTEEQNDT